MSRKVITAAIVLGLAAACASSPSMESSNERLIQNLYDAFARGDVPAVLAAMDDRISWNEAENHPYADMNPYIGGSAVAEGVFGRVVADFENFSATPREIISEGDTVVAIGRYTGMRSSTRLPLDAQFVHVFKIRNGKITSFQQYTDTEQFVRLISD